MDLADSAGTIKIVLAVIITALLTFFLTREFSGNYEKVGSTSDTTSSVTVKYTTSANTFTAELVGKIKKRLIDSLSGNIKAKIKQVFVGPVLPAVKPDSADQQAAAKTEEELQYVYTSEMDTTIIAKDSTGKTIDSTKIQSSVFSDIPLSQKLIHLISVENNSYNKETIKEKKITNTAIVEKKKSLFDLIKIKLGVVAGWDFINKQLGVVVGAGFTFDL